MAQKDYYDVLGVSRDADDATIKKAFRQLSKKYHPDINHEPGAEEKFKEINEAYQVLSDPQKRAAFDQYGSADGPQGGFGGGGQGFSGFGGQGFSGQGTGFEDIFSQFFGGGGQQQRANSPRQGADLQYRMDLKFEEAVFGKDTKISYDRQALCHTCGGSGAKPGTSPITCHKCHGSGYIQVQRNTPLGAMMSQEVCDVCVGLVKKSKTSVWIATALVTRTNATPSTSKCLLVLKTGNKCVCAKLVKPEPMAALMGICTLSSALPQATSSNAMARRFT